MDGLHLVPVATGLSDFEAKLLAAQLGSEGILWQTRGIVDSIYPFGGIDVLVPADQLDEARQAVVAIGGPLVGAGAAPGSDDAGGADVDVERADRRELDAGPDREDPAGAGTSASIGTVRTSRWLGLAAVVGAVGFALVRVLAVV